MAKLKVILLTRNREVKLKYIKPNSENFIFDNGLYPIGLDKISNWEIEDKLRGSEIIFFEGNPIAISNKKIEIKEESKGEIKDESNLYLDNLLISNALKQTSKAKMDFQLLTGLIEWITDPGNIIILLFMGAVIWGLFMGFKI